MKLVFPKNYKFIFFPLKHLSFYEFKMKCGSGWMLEVQLVQMNIQGDGSADDDNICAHMSADGSWIHSSLHTRST